MIHAYDMLHSTSTRMCKVLTSTMYLALVVIMSLAFTMYKVQYSTMHKDTYYVQVHMVRVPRTVRGTCVHRY